MNYEPKYVPGHGSSSAKLMIVAEATGKHEEEQGFPLVGPTGQLVNEFLTNAGVSRPEVYCTNVIKIRPPGNDLKRLHEYNKTIDEYIPQLWEEIQAIQPNCIIALGNLALTTITGK